MKKIKLHINEYRKFFLLSLLFGFINIFLIFLGFYYKINSISYAFFFFHFLIAFIIYFCIFLKMTFEKFFEIVE